MFTTLLCVRFFSSRFFGKKIEFLWYDDVESEYIIMKSVENDSKVNVLASPCCVVFIDVLAMLSGYQISASSRGGM